MKHITSTKLLNLGRLGNQLFIISAALAYGREHHCKVTFPDWKYREFLETADPSLQTLIPPGIHRHCLPWVTYKEPQPYHYAPIQSSENWIDLYGFFQSETYFKSQETVIRQAFRPKPEIRTSLLNKYQRILSENPVSLHIRRGDRENSASLASQYYTEAISRFDKNRAYLLFSDDPEWCRYHCRFLSKNLTVVSGQSEFEDLILMSLCQDHITANSTFSWWGAWLSTFPSKRVLTPKNWIFLPDVTQTDLIPNSWEVIS